MLDLLSSSIKYIIFFIMSWVVSCLFNFILLSSLKNNLLYELNSFGNLICAHLKKNKKSFSLLTHAISYIVEISYESPYLPACFLLFRSTKAFTGFISEDALPNHY